MYTSLYPPPPPQVSVVADPISTSGTYYKSPTPKVPALHECLSVCLYVCVCTRSPTLRFDILYQVTILYGPHPISPLLPSPPLSSPPSPLSSPLPSYQVPESTLHKDIGEVLRSGSFSDVTLRVGEKQFRAHKVVLACRSPVFGAMFEHEMTESRRVRTGGVRRDEG